MARRRPILLLTILFAAILAGAPTNGAASCAVTPTGDVLANAPLVFVGTVVSTDDGGRRAVVKVESIWYGPGLPTYVEVIGSPVSGSVATSIDRTYLAGQQYLFVPAVAAQPIKSPFMDNACSATQPYTAALAARAPADTRTPEPGGDQPAAGPPWLLVALTAAGVAVVGAFAFWLWRRRSPRPRRG